MNKKSKKLWLWLVGFVLVGFIILLVGGVFQSVFLVDGASVLSFDVGSSRVSSLEFLSNGGSFGQGGGELLSSGFLVLSDVPNSVRVLTVPRPSIFGVGSNYYVCKATGTKISMSKCCGANGYVANVQSDGIDGWDTCFVYEDVSPDLVSLDVGGVGVPLSRVDGGWVSGDLSSIVNGYCGVISYDNDVCSVPLVVSNRVVDGSRVGLSVGGVVFRDNPLYSVSVVPVDDGVDDDVVVDDNVFWRFWFWLVNLF